VTVSRRRIAITAVSVALLAIFFLSFCIPVQREMGWIDSVTGSTKHQTQATIGFDMAPFWQATPVVKPSALAQWLARHEREIVYDWRHVNGTLKTIWGASAGFEHGDAPPIYSLPEQAIRPFVESSTDEELRQFIEVMRKGTHQAQEAAVNAAVERGLKSGH
jgi:hypothetical protein